MSIIPEELLSPQQTYAIPDALLPALVAHRWPNLQKLVEQYNPVTVAPPKALRPGQGGVKGL